MFKPTNTTLYLVRGVPGCGKSTFAEQLRLSGLVTQFLEADKYFIDSEGKYIFDPSELPDAHEWCQLRAKLYLYGGDSVAVSNTSTTEKEVAVYQRIAELTGANFVSIIVENRNNTENIHNVPAEKIQQMKDRFSVKL
jgi:predicted kinase